MTSWIMFGLGVALVDFVVSQFRSDGLHKEVGVTWKYNIFPILIYATLGYLALPFYMWALSKSIKLTREERKELLIAAKEQQDQMFGWED